MTATNVHSLIGPEMRDLSKWPVPDLLPGDQELRLFERRKQAVEMYVEGCKFNEIRTRTGFYRGEVIRLVKRCVTVDHLGRIHGFYALVPGVRVKKYNRTAGHVFSDGLSKGGNAGMLTQIMQRFPEVAESVEKELLKMPVESHVHEARASYKTLHKRFLRDLESKGLTSRDWPFSTRYRGYRSFVNYCHNLRERYLGRWIAARSGKEASRRSGLGQGYTPLIPVLRPYSAVQLDFHKIDAASIIVISNRFGKEFEIPVARWHVGILADEYTRAILGIYISLEPTPSGDCVLETIVSALRSDETDPQSPDYSFVEDGKIVIHQLIPELRFQGFAVLKLDNAWAHTAVEVYNNIISTIGCAVNFGPVRAWWCRNLIENIFGKMTQHGVQRLPSTYGTGPNDTRRDAPNEQAVKYRILLSTLIAIVLAEARRHNLSQSEALEHCSPEFALRAALEKPAFGLFPQPLPHAAQDDIRLLMHVEERIIRGNIKKHVRPHIQFGRMRHTNPQLARQYHLVGKRVLVYIHRQKPWIMRACLLDTGEDLGLLSSPRRWSTSKYSLRTRKLISAAGLAESYQDLSVDSVEKWEKKAKKSLRGKRRKGERRPTTALLMAKVTREAVNKDDAKRCGTEIDSSHSSMRTSQLAPPKDPFNLGSLPTLHHRRQ
ncbi:MAG TPA: hypothetical protein VEC35_17130 [Noviherbaspirillum sp.]|nr:hypothetical protein [Noviherbaspirillum sp.]